MYGPRGRGAGGPGHGAPVLLYLYPVADRMRRARPDATRPPVSGCVRARTTGLVRPGSYYRVRASG